MIGPGIQGRWRKIAEAAAAPLARMGVTPNLATLFGLVLSFPTAFLIATGAHVAGGAMVLVTGAFDSMDGALARVTGRQTVFGAFMDSTLDRFVEVVMFGGLAWYFAAGERRVEAILVLVALAGSLIVSYTRARAEGLGLDCKVGLLQRPERLIILGVGVALSQWLLVPVLWLLALVTNLTALQRIVHVYRQTRGASLDR